MTENKFPFSGKKTQCELDLKPSVNDYVLPTPYSKDFYPHAHLLHILSYHGKEMDTWD